MRILGMEATLSMVFCSASNLVQFPKSPQFSQPTENSDSVVAVQVHIWIFIKHTGESDVSMPRTNHTLKNASPLENYVCFGRDLRAAHLHLSPLVTPTVAAAAALIWRGLGPKVSPQIWPLSSHRWSSEKPTGPLPIRLGILSTLTLGAWESKLVSCLVL